MHVVLLHCFRRIIERVLVWRVNFHFINAMFIQLATFRHFYAVNEKVKLQLGEEKKTTESVNYASLAI